MRGKGVTQRVDVHRLLDPGLLFGFIYRPLYTPLGVAGVEVSTNPSFDLPICTVEYPFVGLFGFQIGFQSTDQNIGKWDVAVFFAFAVLYVENFSVKIQVGDLQIPDFKATQTTPVQQTNQHAMLEQIGCFEKSTDFFLAQDNRKFLAVLDRRKFDPFVFHPLHPIGEAKRINGKLEVGIRRRIMSPLDQMQVIIDPLGIDFCWQFIEMKSQLGQVAAVVGDRALTFTGDGNFLLKLGQ